MRLSAFAVIAAYAALAQVSAAPAPIRLLVVTSSVQEDSPLNGLRFGHAVQPYRKGDDHDLLNSSPPPSDFAVVPTSPEEKEIHASPDGNSLPPKRFRHRPGCHGKKGKVSIFMHRIKIKAIKIGNCFRKALGWPLIEVKLHSHHKHHKDGKKDEDGSIRVDGGFVSILPFPGMTPDNHDDWVKQNHVHNHHGSFLSRLHHSLMNLGRWEGRAIAFVIGCGIGVLVRMFWVLAIVSYRACRGYRDEGYTTVAVMEEYESDDETVISVPFPKVGPPKYIYPVDEKIGIEETI